MRERQRDPVCGMLVDPRTTSYRQQHAGRLYFFCSAGCQSKFLDNPTKYLARSEMTAPPAAPEGTIY
ncbi:MAG TPA: YHS domain-containing protein, partial [Bradyrhizobium sp.]|nr:YHS domain-containing protein [Bradyrhizobium sp.]